MLLNKKKIIHAFIIIWLSLSLLYTAQAAPDAAFQKLQNDLKQEKYKKKVLSRFEVVEGLKGLALDDITLTLLDYSYHILNDSGKPEPFIGGIGGGIGVKSLMLTNPFDSATINHGPSPPHTAGRLGKTFHLAQQI